jgi:RNA polymerase sigma-70 factor, ECF subfamily
VNALSPERTPTDLELFSRFRAGRADAFTTLYGRHRDALYHHARALVRDDGLAEDLVNEAFLRLVEAGDARSGGSLGPFLHKGSPTR